MLPELDLPEQLSLCKSLGVTHYVYRPRVIPDDRRAEPYSNWGNHRFDLTPKRLQAEGADISKRLAANDLVSFCTLPDIDTSTSDDELEMHMRGAANAGCQRIRISPVDYSNAVFDYSAKLDEYVLRYKKLIELGYWRGLKIVIEIHVGNAACGVGLTHAIVRDFDPKTLGVILDLPNLSQQGFIDPVLAVSVLAPWIDHCHVGAARRIDDGKDANGFRQTQFEFCPLAEGDLHLPTWLKALSQLKRTIPLVIENFTPNVSAAERLKSSADTIRSAVANLG